MLQSGALFKIKLAVMKRALMLMFEEIMYGYGTWKVVVNALQISI